MYNALFAYYFGIRQGKTRLIWWEWNPLMKKMMAFWSHGLSKITW